MHEFKKKIDNSHDNLPWKSLAFSIQGAGEIRSGQMLSWKDEMMKQEQYKDLLREAENRALVRQALMERKRAA